MGREAAPGSACESKYSCEIVRAASRPIATQGRSYKGACRGLEFAGMKKPGQGRVFAFHKKDYFLERPLKLLSRVSISIHSSIWMKSATEISVPFFSLAGFMTLPEVSPRAAFSV